jgi:hypothetical protein
MCHVWKFTRDSYVQLGGQIAKILFGQIDHIWALSQCVADNKLLKILIRKIY